MSELEIFLAASGRLHRHLCPRQVLGVRIGMLAGAALGLALPQAGKRVLAIMETDGCAADGVAVATNCWVGRRTLQIVDYGKVAATFVDTATERAVRVTPRADVRDRARLYAPEAVSPWQAQLLGYQRMPAAELLSLEPVILRAASAELIGRPGRRTRCHVCGEEILNAREVRREGVSVCRACAGEPYYGPALTPASE